MTTTISFRLRDILEKETENPAQTEPVIPDAISEYFFNSIECGNVEKKALNKYHVDKRTYLLNGFSLYLAFIKNALLSAGVREKKMPTINRLVMNELFDILKHKTKYQMPTHFYTSPDGDAAIETDELLFRPDFDIADIVLYQVAYQLPLRVLELHSLQTWRCPVNDHDAEEEEFDERALLVPEYEKIKNFYVQRYKAWSPNCGFHLGVYMLYDSIADFGDYLESITAEQPRRRVLRFRTKRKQ